MMRVAVIGGVWGQNYARTLGVLEGFQHYATVTRNSAMSLDNLIQHRQYFDFAVVATPPQVRFEIAKKLIKEKIPLILEKPVALSSKETEKIADLAGKHDVPCLVAYTDLYNPAYRAFRFWASSALRDSRTPFRHLTGVFGNVNASKFAAHWDYGAHVLAILDDLFGELTREYFWDRTGSITHLSCCTADGITASLRFGTGFAAKYRKYALTASSENLSMDTRVEYDDTRSEKKVSAKFPAIEHVPEYSVIPPLAELLLTMRKAVLSSERSNLNYHLRRSANYARILEKLD